MKILNSDNCQNLNLLFFLYEKKHKSERREWPTKNVIDRETVNCFLLPLRALGDWLLRLITLMNWLHYGGLKTGEASKASKWGFVAGRGRWERKCSRIKTRFLNAPFTDEKRLKISKTFCWKVSFFFSFSLSHGGFSEKSIFYIRV